MNVKILNGAVRTPTPSLSEIVRPIVSQLNQVEERLKSVSDESEGILKESSRYVLSNAGKRLRASLVLFCASIPPSASSVSCPESGEVESTVYSPDSVKGRAYGSPLARGIEPRASTDSDTTGKPVASSAVIEIAVAVELIHSATLVHDDIIDRAVLRRLKPTVNVQFGEEVAVLLGDFLYARAFEMISKVGDRKVTAWIAETTQDMCEGELDQLRHRYRADLTLKEYFSFIERKTASLISVCARSGARLAGLASDEINALASFGLDIGISFQIVDDLLDIIGSEKRLGKTLRTDAGNGKMTLPLILIMDHMQNETREQFIINLQSPNPNWETVRSLMKQYHVVERTEQFANDYFKRANQSIKNIHPVYRESLESYSQFVLRRDY